MGKSLVQMMTSARSVSSLSNGHQVKTMNPRFFSISSFVLTGVLVATAVLLSVTVDGDENRPSDSVKTSVTTSVLGGPHRYMTYLSSDKPIYKPGETAYFRGVVLHHATHQPLPEHVNLNAAFNILGPKGDSVASGWVASEESIFGLHWTIPEQQAGGEYTVQISHPGTGYAPAERKFDIRTYRAPRLNSQIKFLRDGYGAGDEVAATLSVERAEGGFPAGAQVTIIARVDGTEVFGGTAVVDANGNSIARFTLPEKITRGEGTLVMTVHDGGVVETASKTIPILLQTVDLKMYPEGGDLVAGLPNRVYFEAFTPAKKPADLAGVILDQKGNEVADFKSQHEGRGRFRLTPEAGEKYSLKITQPSGIDTVFQLPEVMPGAVIQSSKDVYKAGEPVVMKVGVSDDRPCSVSLRQRETEIAKLNFPEGARGLTDAVFTHPDSADGVLVATVLDDNGRPLAERLIFRQPANGLQVKITPSAEQYTPGDLARLDIVTTDAKGEPVSAVVGLTVTDESVLEMVETREQPPRLPVMVLLENDVRDLADAHVYLDPRQEGSELAVDLLLGTQGWRRFAHLNFSEFLAEYGDDAVRAFAVRLQTQYSAMIEATNELADDLFGGAAIPKQAADKEDPNALIGAAIAQQQAPGRALGQAQALAEQPVEEQDEDIAEFEMEQKRDVESRIARQQDNQPVARRRLAAALETAMKVQAEGEIAMNDFLFGDVGDDMVAVRVYAHQVREGRKPDDRVDFTETLYWSAGTKTDENGKASVEFSLNDSVTSFRVFADAFAANGSLGQASTKIESVQPFYLEPKLPLEISTGDRVRIPVGLVNATDQRLGEGRFSARWMMAGTSDGSDSGFVLDADERLRELIGIGRFDKPGIAEVVLSANVDGYQDRVTRSIVVKPMGFPVESGAGGLLDQEQSITHQMTIPPSLVDGSMSTRIVVYPTPLASMTEALERLIREPHGCFEQTSSTTYPLVMAQQYFQTHQGVDPGLIQRSAEMLDKGYRRLTGFESKSGGFEWFGNDPGHDALTAYGLMQFTDMAEVRDVDSAMLQRTREWLLKQRDGKGGFERKTGTLHTWLAVPEVAFTYNTWALLKAGADADLSTEVAWIRDVAEATDNTYVMALAANVFSLAGDLDGVEHMLDKLAGKQASDGSLDGATVSVVGSHGEALKIETTALAAMAWLGNKSYIDNVENAIKYLAAVCKGGRFGSTQSTVLALQAIVAYDQMNAKPKAPGTLQLLVDGMPVGEPLVFNAESRGAIELPEVHELLTEGRHTIEVVMAGGSQMPCSITVDYNTLTPNSSDECRVDLEVSIADRKVEEGGSTEVNVSLFNTTSEKIPTPTAIIGIPGGLEVRHDQLKELVAAGKIAAYEVRGREVILYWLSLEAEQAVDVSISLVAAIPGTYTGPASRAYLYYTDEQKIWRDGLNVKILPAK